LSWCVAWRNVMGPGSATTNDAPASSRYRNRDYCLFHHRGTEDTERATSGKSEAVAGSKTP
jgi:hypothetical protein